MRTRPVFVSGGLRTPFVKSMTTYMDVTSSELMSVTLQKLVQKYKLEGQLLGDVAFGAVMQSASDWNFTREVVQNSGLNPHTPGYNVQRACGTSLETANHMALKISAHQIDIGIAGGVDTNSDLPIMVSKSLSHKLVELNAAKSGMEKAKILASLRFSDLKPQLPAVVEPRTKLSMGEHTEKMVKEWMISRAEQDELAYQSHQKAAKAYDEGFYKDLVFEFKGLNRDGILRADTTIEKLGKLRPAFDKSDKGTLTAGNSTPLTDGSSAVIMTSEDAAKRLNLPLWARFVDCQASAVNYVAGEGLLMAPTIAVSEMLKRNNLSFDDFDYFEIHEAFAGQVLCTLKAWESDDYCKKVLGRSIALGPIDRSKMNVKGGSVAVGHPFGATGARIVASLSKMLHEKGSKGRGLISICTAGGMGVAAILESV
ncbi:acetyl-CoA C-acetyltransferase [Bdellovibrio reynosensis]|uniref:Acetyl-CoA C-acetyltransferase n=1 Tax=Bdellovibrio reynosensis TaxID=2835041 RepID=A0ABY4CJT5_9BACT|nr:acetyl-CoA C-acetyltransferase [Bdellovibrio reynosensis]UOF02500.1 acetyl-CoA C-acetyltransferase [Bdellovibrio reynosensis]